MANPVDIVPPNENEAIAKAAGAQVQATAPPPPSLQGTAMGQANAMAGAEVAGQVAPLQSQLGATRSAESGAEQQLGSEFKSLLPAVQGSAARVEAFNKNAQSASQQIFQAAGQQLNATQQNQAAEAQQLAQQIGSPVSTGTFTSSLDPYRQAEGASGAIGQLTTLNQGLGADTSAEKFAGQVFPALETEQRQNLRQFYGGQIVKLQDEISKIQGTRTKLADSKYPALLSAERTYQLNQAKLQLDRVKATETWSAKQEDLRIRDQQLADTESRQKTLAAQGWARVGQGAARIAVSQRQADIAAQRLTDTEKATAAHLQISEADYALRAAHYAEGDKIAKERLQVQQEGNARSIIDAALGGTNSNKPVTQTIKQILPPDDPHVRAALSPGVLVGIHSPPANVYHDTKTGQWYTYVKLTMTPAEWAKRNGSTGTPTSDPNTLYHLITTAMPSFKKSLAVDLVRERLGLKNWTPDAKGNPAAPEGGLKTQPVTAADLAKMALPQLTDFAISYGFPPSPRAASKQQLIDFVLSHPHH